jgi:hypothetical protein
MFKTVTQKTTLLATLIGALSLAIPARATITFDGSGADSNTYQQTLNNPCVIGDPSCQEPSGMTYTSSSGPQGTYDFFSPVYLATDPFTTFSGNLIPTTFTIGIDDNLANSATLEVLQFFNVWSCTSSLASSCTTLVGSNSYTGPTDIPDNNTGNGFSDATLKGFSLTAGTHYLFEAKVSNDTDGMEEFFIIQNGSSPIPEPVTSALVGSGLIALFFVRRRARG